jgi:hypothetical protein
MMFFLKFHLEPAVAILYLQAQVQSILFQALVQSHPLEIKEEIKEELLHLPNRNVVTETAKELALE